MILFYTYCPADNTGAQSAITLGEEIMAGRAYLPGLPFRPIQ